MDCKKPAEHANHVCQMKINQKFEEVRELSKSAQFYCKVCEAQSSNKDNLCDPVEYKGKAGVLKWK